MGPSLAERLRATAYRLMDGSRGYDTALNKLLIEAAEALTPKPWPPPPGTRACVGRSEHGHGHEQWESLAYGSEGWYWVTGEQPADECPPDAWIPWPEGGGE